MRRACLSASLCIPKAALAPSALLYEPGPGAAAQLTPRPANSSPAQARCLGVLHRRCSLAGLRPRPRRQATEEPGRCAISARAAVLGPLPSLEGPRPWVGGRPWQCSTPCETSTSTDPVGEVQEAHAAAVGLGEEARGWARVGGSRWRHRRVRDKPWQQC